MAIDAGSIYSSVRVKLDALKGDVRSVETLLDQIGHSSQTNADKSEQAFTSSFNATKLAGVAAFAAITVAMKQSIKVAGDYEQSIADVQSVVMGTDEVFQQLSEAAKEAGETTRFTASQAADAMYDLASGGMSAEESIASLNGILMLAGATQSSLSEAARITVATLNQYNLKAEEATRISNVFAASMANSMADMDKLTAGMRQVGPVASAMGLSLEETVGALSALYDAGFQGEQAGTALRAILASVASEADPTTKKLMEMGLTFDQINPAANSFADVIQNISDAGLTAGDVMNAFGTRAGAQMLALLNQGKKGLEEYERAVTGTSTASEMYAIQNDTLAGSLDRLKSAAESAQIEFVEEFTPVMRAFLGLLTDITIKVADLPGPLKVFFGVLLAGIPVTMALTNGLVALKAAMLGVSGPIGWAVAAVAAAAAGFSALKTKLDAIETEKTNRDFGELAETMGITAEKLKELTEEAENFGLELTEFDNLVKVLGLSNDQLELLQFMLNQAAMSGGHVTEYIGRWAEVLGISAEALMRVLVASDMVNEADRAYINTLLGTLDMEKKRNGERVQAAKTEQELLLEEKRAIASRNAERLAGLKAEGEEQKALFDVYDATLAEIDRKMKLGVLTEKEALEEKKKASDKLIKSLLEQETQYLNNDKAIMEAVATGKEYEQGAKDIEAAEKAAEKAAEEREQALEDLAKQTLENKQKTEELGKTDIEIAELRRDRELAAIDAIKAETDEEIKARDAARAGVVAYYDAYIALMKAKEDKTAADAEQEKLTEYQQKLEEVGKDEIALLEVQRKRALEAANGNEKLEESINAYYDALVNDKNTEKAKKDAEQLKKLNDEQIDSATSYQQKLEDMGKTELELIEIERKRAIAAALASGASEEAINNNIIAINAYYDALKETTAEDAAIAKTKKMAQDIKGIWDDLSGSLASLFSAIYDDKLDALEAQLKAELEAAGLQEKSAAELAEAELEEARKQSAEEIALIQKRLDAATDAGDTQSAMLIQQQLDAANAQAEETEREKQAALDKAKIEEDYANRKKKIEYDAALVSWKIQMAQAVANAAMVALNGFLTKPFIPAGLIAGGVATAQGALQIAAVKMAKPKLATGGIVLPQAGGRDVTLAENGYPEMALNSGPSGQELMGIFAQQIVDKMRGGNAKQSLTINVQVDRKTLSTLVVDDINNGRVRLER